MRRYELDPAARDKIFAAQRKMRREEGNTAEKRTVMYVESSYSSLLIIFTWHFRFFNTITSRKCDATDVNGKQCSGKPKLKEQKKVYRFYSAQRHYLNPKSRFSMVASSGLVVVAGNMTSGKITDSRKSRIMLMRMSSKSL